MVERKLTHEEIVAYNDRILNINFETLKHNRMFPYNQWLELDYLPYESEKPESLFDQQGHEIGQISTGPLGTGIDIPLELPESPLKSMGPLHAGGYNIQDYRTGRPSLDVRDADNNSVGTIDIASNGNIFNPSGGGGQMPPPSNLP